MVYSDSSPAVSALGKNHGWTWKKKLCYYLTFTLTKQRCNCPDFSTTAGLCSSSYQSVCGMSSICCPCASRDAVSLTPGEKVPFPSRAKRFRTQDAPCGTQPSAGLEHKQSSVRFTKEEKRSQWTTDLSSSCSRKPPAEWMMWMLRNWDNLLHFLRMDIHFLLSVFFFFFF